NAAKRASAAVTSRRYNSLPASVRRPITWQRRACQADPGIFGLLQGGFDAAQLLAATRGRLVALSSRKDDRMRRKYAAPPIATHHQKPTGLLLRRSGQTAPRSPDRHCAATKCR